jgi:FtsP/CotA-like multicopper oxidase with cupredoxin domain
VFDNKREEFMDLQRRDILKSAAALLAAPIVSQWTSESAEAAENAGPFSQPTTKFQPGAQHQLPPWAFSHDVVIPRVPRPTAVGDYEELVGKPVFGPGDPTPLGECFHGIAREWGETPEHWRAYGCDPSKKGAEAWKDKREHFGAVESHEGGAPVANWGGFKIKCYKIPIRETEVALRPDTAFKARLYSYAGHIPGPTLKMRLGQPVVVRFENHLEAETSVHLHGGHSPSHSDGFPTFYVLQGKARDYFYPNILPLYADGKDAGGKTKYAVDVGESQSTMWYHDHAMDATAYNVSKGLAGFAPCLGECELELIAKRILPGYGPDSCRDPERDGLKTAPRDVEALEDPDLPGFYRREKEPYRNPFDIALVLQDRVIDLRSGQVAYDNTGHNGYIGETMLVNGVAWPRLTVRNRKYRFRLLDGSNARVYRLRILTADDFWKAQQFGIGALDNALDNGAEATPAALASKYDDVSKPFMRIGKDSWLWSFPIETTSLVLAMANRADIVVDFNRLAADLKPHETREFFLVNTMPQFDGRGPKPKLDDGGDPRVLPLPFDDPQGQRMVELEQPVGLMKFVVTYGPPGKHPEDPPGDREAKVEPVEFDVNRRIKPGTGTPLITTHREIKDEEVAVVREFIFERGKGAWQINSRFYDPAIANATPVLDQAEEWVLRNGGGGWWHPIHIHLESHQLVGYEKDFGADAVIDPTDPPEPARLVNLQPVLDRINPIEVRGLHDTTVLGPNTVARIRMRHRTWYGPFVFHCHNVEHEDMRMMFNFEPVPAPHDPNVGPDARTHGNDVTLHGNRHVFTRYVGELPWEFSPVPETPITDAGEEQIPPRPRAK